MKGTAMLKIAEEGPKKYFQVTGPLFSELSKLFETYF